MVLHGFGSTVTRYKFGFTGVSGLAPGLLATVLLARFAVVCWSG